MEATAGRRSNVFRTAGALVSAVALLAAFATVSGASTNPNTGYPKGNLTAAQIKLAASYTGGVANKTAKGTPVKVGFINDDNGLVAYPENTAGANLGVWLVNKYLDGVKGHPIQLDRCQGNDDTSVAACAVQMVDDHVKVVLTGTIINNNSQMYKTLFTAHIPVIIGNGLTTPDFAPPAKPTPGTGVTYMPGSPGVILGMAKFLGTNGLGSKPKSIAVVYTSDAGAVTAYNFLFKTDKYLKGIPIKGVEISDTATASQVESAINASGAKKASVFVPLVPVQGCISVYDAMKTLKINPKVVTTGLCFGTPLIAHLHGTFPNGWYFGDYGVNYFIYKSSLQASVQLAVYIAAVHQDNPTMQYTGFAGPSFGNVLTVTRFYNALGTAASSAKIASLAKSFKGPQWGIPGPLHCGFDITEPAVCGQTMGIAQFKSGKWIPIEDAYNNKLIDGFK